DGSQRHRLYMYFYDDASWGSSEHNEGNTVAGQVVINAIDLILPLAVSNEEHVNNIPNVIDVNNYPNPFNPQTSIAYTLKNSGDVKLSVYNVKGQKVDTLVNERQTAGEHTIVWDATSNASGVYFLRLESGSNSVTRKMMMIK
ncbi:MAG: T9SS type A sorting domain-containing protein, partial [Candidatus Cloacimonetes bacterium]|nr:T9SS type A sorting domain-containing protein [Candidatus Cloacimonadota bacterium]